MPDMTSPFDPDGGGESAVEAELRHLLAEHADGFAPRATPYASIVRQGRAARRRGRIALGAGAAVMAAAVPAATLASGNLWPGGEDESDLTAPAAPSGGEQEEQSRPSPTTPEGAQGPSDPERQLLDGITLEQANTSLERCLEEFPVELDGGFPEIPEGESSGPVEPPGPSDVAPEDLRILFAWINQGDENSGVEPMTRVLAVSEDAEADPQVQLVCADRASGSQGVQSSVGSLTLDNGLPVYPDPNASRYYGPMMGEWELPFRWADFGLVSPEVDRVTVTYGGETVEAVLEAGYFMAAGISEVESAGPPHIVGYDPGGWVVYDSNDDPTYH
ncbi:hypothetical protein ACTWP5_18760 [Streptomyces sp. 4N509B]|uniref:hypothetical protein n=1 Tax=Streptomyces sp. 4N509B TaxID=3457413 RepID=UPI003FD49E1A